MGWTTKSYYSYRKSHYKSKEMEYLREVIKSLVDFSIFSVFLAILARVSHITIMELKKAKKQR